MEEQRFAITIDPGRNLLRVVWRGFWVAATVEAYERELKAAVARMLAAGCRRDGLLALVDARDLGAQSQEVIQQYQDRFSAPERQPRRLATLASSMLFRRQVERVALPNQRLFDDEAEALAWLLS